MHRRYVQADTLLFTLLLFKIYIYNKDIDMKI